MQFLDGAIDNRRLDFDDFAFVIEQQKPAKLQLVNGFSSLKASPITW